MLSTEFLLISLIVVLIPGTGVIYTISTALFQGMRASIFAALGCTLGIVPHLVSCILGLSVMLHMSATVFSVIKLLGAAYLLYLAWSMWRDRGGIVLEKGSSEPKLKDTALKGFLINILNPKLSLFFLAFIPQFVTLGSTSVTLDMLVLSSVFMGMTFVVFIGYAMAADKVRHFILRSNKGVQYLQRSFAVAFAALGVKLALTDR